MSTAAARIVDRMKRGYAEEKARAMGPIPPPPTPGDSAATMGKGPVSLEGMPMQEKPASATCKAKRPIPLPPKPIREHENAAQEVGDSSEGIGITESPGEAIPEIKGKDRSRLQKTNISYSLIPRYPKKGDKVFAYANIKWNPKVGEVVYNVVEPPLSKKDQDIIELTKRILEERLDIDFFKIGEIKAKAMLGDEITSILNKNPEIPAERMGTLRYYLERDIVGLGKIAPLMNDPNVEDISCDGINIPVYVYHRDPNLGSLKTNVVFTSDDELNTYVVKLAQRCKKSISIAEPLLDGSLPDGSRIQATLGTDIARKGSNFTIRRFSEEPLTPTHMLKFGTVNSTQMAYLWLAIENGLSILISGGTATGKTSMLNALSLFIRPNLKIVSIEDTPELRLPHPHWIPEVARNPISMEGSVGEVSLFDLLKSSLRQRPDYIVMGEVRGKEAFVLFQQMATGHPSLATIHAASISQLMDRLTTPPISLPPSLICNVNIIVFLIMSRMEGMHVRRAENIMEITGMKDNKPTISHVFKWMPSEDKFMIKDRSVVLKDIAFRLGLGNQEIKNELARRRSILEWMLANGIFDFREVARIISLYYSNPQKVIKAVGGE